MKVKSEALRQKIIDVTTDLILESGFAAASTVQVARLAQTSQSNIYKYFSNRQALLLAVFKYHQQLMIKASAPTPSLAPLAGVIQFAQQELQFATQHPQSIQIIAVFRAQPRFRAQLPTIADSAALQLLFDNFEKCQKAGVIKRIPAEFLAEGVFSIIVNFTTAQLAQESYMHDLTQAEALAMIEDMVRIH